MLMPLKQANILMPKNVDLTNTQSLYLQSGHKILKPFQQKRQSCHHIETSQLICRANQLKCFYMMTTLEFNELKTRLKEKKLLDKKVKDTSTIWP